jgi:hypothetical protein
MLYGWLYRWRENIRDMTYTSIHLNGLSSILKAFNNDVSTVDLIQMDDRKLHILGDWKTTRYRQNCRWFGRDWKPVPPKTNQQRILTWMSSVERTTKLRDPQSRQFLPWQRIEPCTHQTIATLQLWHDGRLLRNMRLSSAINWIKRAIIILYVIQDSCGFMPREL